MKTPKKHVYVLLSLLLFVPRIGFSQTNSDHYRAALELLDVVNAEKAFKSAIDITLTAQLKANPNLGPFEDILRSFLAKYANWSNLKAGVAELYMNEFTENELREMINFYKTETGKKAAEKMPILFSKGAELGRQAVEDHKGELIEAIQKRAKELNGGQ